MTSMVSAIGSTLLRAVRAVLAYHAHAAWHCAVCRKPLVEKSPIDTRCEDPDCALEWAMRRGSW